MGQKCSCGIWNNDSAKFCRNCGKKLSLISSEKTKSGHNSTSTGNQNSSRSEMGETAKFIIGAICIICIILGFVMFFTGVVGKPGAMAICLAGVGGLKLVNS